MRKLLIGLLVVAAALAAAGFAAEQLMVRELRRLSDQGAAFSAARVEPLPGALKIGARLTQPVAVLPEGRVSFESADIWVQPLSPLTARIRLPEKALLDLPDGRHELLYAQPDLTARFDALSGFAPREFSFDTSDLVLDGTPLARAVALNGKAIPMGPEAPVTSRAGFDLALTLDGLDPKALPALARLGQALGPEDLVSLTAEGRFWLDKVPTPQAMAAIPTPALTGLELTRSTLDLGRIQSRIIGRLDADGEGRAQGGLAVYTADAGAMLTAATEAGMIPKSARGLLQAILRSISSMPVPANTAFAFPDATEGELRLPLTFAEGRAALGPVPLGPAPRLSP